MPGIKTSMSTISGCVRVDLATASLPSSASARTCHCLCCSTRLLTYSRNVRLSSATRKRRVASRSRWASWFSGNRCSSIEQIPRFKQSVFGLRALVCFIAMLLYLVFGRHIATSIPGNISMFFSCEYLMCQYLGTCFWPSGLSGVLSVLRYFVKITAVSSKQAGNLSMIVMCLPMHAGN